MSILPERSLYLINESTAQNILLYPLSFPNKYPNFLIFFMCSGRDLYRILKFRLHLPAGWPCPSDEFFCFPACPAARQCVCAAGGGVGVGVGVWRACNTGG